MGDVMTVYKVVAVRARTLTGEGDARRDPSQVKHALTSVVAEGQAEVVYKVGAPAKAPAWLQSYGLHLTVFESLGAAVRFIRASNYGHFAVVYEAQAEGERAKLPQRCWLAGLAKGRVSPSVPLDEWPSGTRMAEHITLTRCVWSRISVPEIGITRGRIVA